MSLVRNPEGIWINTNCFREAALHYQKYGYYNNDPIGSPDWEDYWDMELDRCVNGYKVGGAHITGNHYFYLNFCPIMLTEQSFNEQIHKTSSAKKKLLLPDFWDGDYNYFHVLDIARNGATKEQLKALQLEYYINDEHLNGGYHLCVGKARRKGYSYKNASILANIYNTIPNSLSIVGAYNKIYLYPRGTMGMATSYLDHLNKATAWGKSREYIDRPEHRKSSYKETSNGKSFESGFLSEIQAITFKDNESAARGKDAYIILFEEAGRFPNLIDSVRATQDSMSDGIFQTGQFVIFGTGGDMDNDTIDFSKIFYNPNEYKCISFKNIWDENRSDTFCSFFVPDHSNLVGFYDEQGNSDHERAKEYAMSERKKLIEVSSSLESLHKLIQEHPLSPSEAFLTTSFNDFPVTELRNRLNLVLTEKLHLKFGTPGTMYRGTDKEVHFKPDLNNELEPLWDYQPKTSNLSGCIVVYEAPLKGFTYKGGYYSYRINQFEPSDSLGAVYIYKDTVLSDNTSGRIVASYIGRPETTGTFHRQLFLLLEWYNEMEIMHDNYFEHVRGYFEREGKLKYLTKQPDWISKKYYPYKYGCPMTLEMINRAKNLYGQMLLQEIGTNDKGEKLTFIDTICDTGLLDESIRYEDRGRFPRVYAMFQLCLQSYIQYVENERKKENDFEYGFK